MLAQTIKVDPSGQITLPQTIVQALGVAPEGEVMIELTDQGIVVKPKEAGTPITDSIAAMELPVADWEQMEKEIEAGRLS